MNIRKALKGLSAAKTLFTILIFVIAVLFYACKSNKDKSAEKNATQVSLTQLLIGDGSHVFRNASFGQDPKTVAASEKKTPDETDTNYLSYTLPVDTLHADSVNEDIDSLNYFTIAYNFDQQKLNEIDEDVFLTNDSIAAKVATRLSDYFTSKYGESASGSDSKVWSFKNNGKKMKVTLSDQSDEYDYGKLSLVFYCEDY
jgi:hypothetical protein